MITRIIDRILGVDPPTKVITTELPTELVHAIETLTLLLKQNDADISRDDVIEYAISEYVRKNLYATMEVDQRVEIKRIKTFERKGQAQLR